MNDKWMSAEDFNADYKYQYTRDELEDETIVIDIPDTERFIIGVF